MRIEPWRARADLAVGAGSGDDLLPSEQARRVVAQANRRRGLDELRAFSPDVKLASRQPGDVGDIAALGLRHLASRVDLDRSAQPAVELSGRVPRDLVLQPVLAGLRNQPAGALVAHGHPA